MRPFDQRFPISARLSAALPAAHACLHPGDFLQDYSCHTLDCGFLEWTTRSNSNFSRSSFVSPDKTKRVRQETICDGQRENCSKVNNFGRQSSTGCGEESPHSKRWSLEKKMHDRWSRNAIWLSVLNEHNGRFGRSMRLGKHSAGTAVPRRKETCNRHAGLGSFPQPTPDLVSRSRIKPPSSSLRRS